MRPAAEAFSPAPGPLQATMLLRATARLEYLNEAAMALLAHRDPLLADNGYLGTVHPAATERLWALIAAVPTATQKPGTATSSLTLARRGGGPGLTLYLVPLRRALGAAAAGLVLASAITEPPLTPLDRLRHRFHLTPAEARLATTLSRGQPLKDAAFSLGITRETAKSQLRGIYSKLGIHRQAQLVAVVAEIFRGYHPNGG